MKSGAKNVKMGRRRAWKVTGKERGVQSEVELARFWKGFCPGRFTRFVLFAGMYLPSSYSTLLQC